MAAVKKNIVVLFLVVALGGALLICAGQSSLEKTEVIEQDFGPDNTDDSGSESFSLFSEESDLLDESNDALSNNELFFRAIFTVLVVIVLAGAAVYASKKLLPKITKLPGREIHIIETVYLGQRKALHLIETGNRRLLIGSTNENITRLADVTNDMTIETQQFVESNSGLNS